MFDLRIFNYLYRLGIKRRFIFAGSLNILLTNLLLQFLLLIDFFSIHFSTLISILFNASVGLILYGNMVFRIKNVAKIYYIIKYSILLIFSWTLMNISILTGLKLGLSSNLSALILIIPLAIISFLVQKFWIFIN